MREASLPHADKEQKTGIACRMCGAAAQPALSATILYRHRIGYYLCEHCGMLQSEQPYWLDEAYSEALAAADTGVMQRNLWLMKCSSVLFRLLGMQQARFLDYGGAHGVFTRLMRDHGFDFRCWDAHAENLFARGFEGDPQAAYDGVTAFEVLEHLEQPGDFFADVLGRMRPQLLLLSTELFSEPVDRDWHYFYFATGQHIAFCQQGTLDWVARKYGYCRLTVGSLHLFLSRPAPALLRSAMRQAARLYPLLRFPSLVAADHRLQLQDAD